MIRNTFFNSNPFDEIDNQIKYCFSKKYGLCLNKLNYHLFGIVDDYFLISLIGESSLFHVYLGYKNGLFYAVKVMKRYKFDSKEAICSRIDLFEKEIDVRSKLQSQEVSKYLVKIHHVNFEKYIIYEDYCANGSLENYVSGSMTEKLIKTIFLNILNSLKNINEGSRLYHIALTPKHVMFDSNFNFKIIGLRNLSFSVFSSEIYYNNFCAINEDEQQQVTMLIIMLCKMLFNEDFADILVFLRTNLNTVDLRQENEEVHFALSNGIDLQDQNAILNKLDSQAIGNANTNNSSCIFSKNMEFLEELLDSLLKKHKPSKSINDSKNFIMKLIKDRSLEDIEFTNWYNDEVLDSQSYYYEMNNYRWKALAKRFEHLSVIEKHLINLKTGIFKVIK